MTRVLVTGATGYVGRHVVAALAARGFDVHGVARSAPAQPGSIHWHEADLLDASARRTLLDDAAATGLVHLAWCARPPSFWTDAANLDWLAASLDLVREFAARGGRRVLGVGSFAEYDWTAGSCVERGTPLAGTSLYAACKAACGSVIEAYAPLAGLSAAWARLFLLFGPGDAGSRLVPSLVTTLAAGRPARCLSGDHVRDFLYVPDAADALAALFDSAVTGPVNVASGRPMRLGDLAQRIAARLDRRELLSVDSGSPEHAVVTADVTRLREEVGWQPPTDPDAGLDATIDWWRSAAATEVRA